MGPLRTNLLWPVPLCSLLSTSDIIFNFLSLASLFDVFSLIVQTPENVYRLFFIWMETWFLQHPLRTWGRYTCDVSYNILLYRHECFTGKYTTRKIHTKPSGVFSISSPVRILMTSFPAVFTVVCTNSRWKMASDKFVYVIKRKLHGGLKIRILFSRVKNNISPLEKKIHIFAPTCNILHVPHPVSTLCYVFFRPSLSRVSDCCRPYHIVLLRQQTSKSASPLIQGPQFW